MNLHFTCILTTIFFFFLIQKYVNLGLGDFRKNKMNLNPFSQVYTRKRVNSLYWKANISWNSVTATKEQAWRKGCRRANCKVTLPLSFSSVTQSRSNVPAVSRIDVVTVDILLEGDIEAHKGWIAKSLLLLHCFLLLSLCWDGFFLILSN